MDDDDQLQYAYFLPQGIADDENETTPDSKHKRQKHQQQQRQQEMQRQEVPIHDSLSSKIYDGGINADSYNSSIPSSTSITTSSVLDNDAADTNLYGSSPSPRRRAHTHTHTHSHPYSDRHTHTHSHGRTDDYHPPSSQASNTSNEWNNTGNSFYSHSSTGPYIDTPSIHHAGNANHQHTVPSTPSSTSAITSPYHRVSTKQPVNDNISYVSNDSNITSSSGGSTNVNASTSLGHHSFLRPSAPTFVPQHHIAPTSQSSPTSARPIVSPISSNTNKTTSGSGITTHDYDYDYEYEHDYDKAYSSRYRLSDSHDNSIFVDAVPYNEDSYQPAHVHTPHHGAKSPLPPIHIPQHHNSTSATSPYIFYSAQGSPSATSDVSSPQHSQTSTSDLSVRNYSSAFDNTISIPHTHAIDDEISAYTTQPHQHQHHQHPTQSPTSLNKSSFNRSLVKSPSPTHQHHYQHTNGAITSSNNGRRHRRKPSPSRSHASHGSTSSAATASSADGSADTSFPPPGFSFTNQWHSKTSQLPSQIIASSSTSSNTPQHYHQQHSDHMSAQMQGQTQTQTSAQNSFATGKKETWPKLSAIKPVTVTSAIPATSATVPAPTSSVDQGNSTGGVSVKPTSHAHPYPQGYADVVTQQSPRSPINYSNDSRPRSSSLPMTHAAAVYRFLASSPTPSSTSTTTSSAVATNGSTPSHHHSTSAATATPTASNASSSTGNNRAHSHAGSASSAVSKGGTSLQKIREKLPPGGVGANNKNHHPHTHTHAHQQHHNHNHKMHYQAKLQYQPVQQAQSHSETQSHAPMHPEVDSHQQQASSSLPQQSKHTLSSRTPPRGGGDGSKQRHHQHEHEGALSGDSGAGLDAGSDDTSSAVDDTMSQHEAFEDIDAEEDADADGDSADGKSEAPSAFVSATSSPVLTAAPHTSSISMNPPLLHDTLTSSDKHDYDNGNDLCDDIDSDSDDDAEIAGQITNRSVAVATSPTTPSTSAAQHSSRQRFKGDGHSQAQRSVVVSTGAKQQQQGKHKDVSKKGVTKSNSRGLAAPSGTSSSETARQQLARAQSPDVEKRGLRSSYDDDLNDILLDVSRQQKHKQSILRRPAATLIAVLASIMTALLAAIKTMTSTLKSTFKAIANSSVTGVLSDASSYSFHVVCVIGRVMWQILSISGRIHRRSFRALKQNQHLAFCVAGMYIEPLICRTLAPYLPLWFASITWYASLATFFCIDGYKPIVWIGRIVLPLLMCIQDWRKHELLFALNGGERIVAGVLFGSFRYYEYQHPTFLATIAMAIPIAVLSGADTSVQWLLLLFCTLNLSSSSHSLSYHSSTASFGSRNKWYCEQSSSSLSLDPAIDDRRNGNEKGDNYNNYTNSNNNFVPMTGSIPPPIECDRPINAVTGGSGGSMRRRGNKPGKAQFTRGRA